MNLTDCLSMALLPFFVNTVFFFMVAKIVMSTMKEVKTSLRKKTRMKLMTLGAEAITEASEAITDRLINLPAWKKATAISCYISMPNSEVQTSGVLENALQKQLFVPKVLGMNSPDMVMLKVKNLEEIDTFPKSKWGIPESPEDGPDKTYDGIIDLVVVPGVVFDTSCHRVGHGKGYYDCFLSRINEEHAKRNLPRPVTIGLCFDEQVVDEPVPTEGHDVPLDLIVTPSRILSAQSDE